ncbi:MAG: glycosyltransferase family 4 protein [Flavobacteriaceae bacterium]|jgi:glycosyltransferase involved in cell wall biosynthesis|nr:glycosyltransferase family 4 protein [Flavobacteriaceae bacterium]
MKHLKLVRITTVPISLKILLKGQLKFMSKYFEVTGIASPGKELEEVKMDEEIQVMPVNMSRKITPIKDLQSLWHIYRFLRKEKPQIVHTHTPKAGIIGMLAAKLAKIPHRLHTVAGLPLMETSGIKRKILDIVEKITYRCATKIYPNSKGLYDFILKNNYTDGRKLKIIASGSSNGIDTDFFSPEQISEKQKQNLKQKLNLKNSDFVFIFVGRLVKDKGINELISVFKNLDQKNAKLLLVGNFEPRLDPLLPETSKEIENNPNIISVGFQNDVRPYFAISDALVFPSYREGFPNVVMQAGAMELPSIVTDINGCNEIIIEGKNGIIIPVKNAEAIEQAMKKMFDDKNLYEKLKQNARPMIVSRYEQKMIWKALLEEYRSLLEEKN